MYFQMLANALTNARVQGPAVVTQLGDVDNPDMIAEVADLLLRDDETTWTLAAGYWQQKLWISIRTSDESRPAEKVVRSIVARRGTGGGHQTYAGGQIPLKSDTKAERKHIEKLVLRRFLSAVGGDAQQRGSKLVQT